MRIGKGLLGVQERVKAIQSVSSPWRSGFSRGGQ